MRALASIAITLLAVAGCHDASTPDGGASDCPVGTDVIFRQPTHTPRWAFEPWISKDISTTDDTYDFVNGFKSRDIPVGVVVLDSPWETQYNTFVPNPTRYHDFAKLSGDLHGMDVRLVLWVTQMVNQSSLDLEATGDKYTGPSPNYEVAQRCKLTVNDGENYVWWKGSGAGIDFFNPAAVSWWHRQQDAILPLIDGWKLDFGDSYVLGDTVDTAQGTISHQAYSEAYYEDFLAYGVTKRGPQFTTLVRGWDKSYSFAGRFYARPEDAPVVWAGDNRRDGVGLVDALETTFRSSLAGYVVTGSDLGGYLDVDDKTYQAVPPDWDLFTRWMAISALSPFMQLHGRANLTPWTIADNPDQMVSLYKYWATLHHELVPYFFSRAEAAYAMESGRTGIIRPVGDEKSWAGDWSYTVGDELFVAPLVNGQPGPQPTMRDITLPGTSAVHYFDWWDEAAPSIAGGTTISGYSKAQDRGRVPLFVKEGAIIPMSVAEDVTGMGNTNSKGALTVLVYPSATRQTTFDVFDTDGNVFTLGTGMSGDGGIGGVVAAAKSSVYAASLGRPLIVRLRTDKPITGLLDQSGQPLAATEAMTLDALLSSKTEAFFNEPALRRAWVRVPTVLQGVNARF